MFWEGPQRPGWEPGVLGRPQAGAPDPISPGETSLRVRKEGGLRLQGLRGAEKTSTAGFTDSRAHPVSTGLPPALCARPSAKAARWSPEHRTGAHPAPPLPLLLRETDKMQGFLCGAAEPGNECGGGTQRFAAYTSSHHVRIADTLTAASLGSFFPGASGWPPQRQAPNSLWGGERGWGVGSD